MSVAGNLTTVTIVESDLTSRFPTLNSYRPTGQSDWAPQIAAGTADALEAFRVAKDHDPTRAKAVDDADWKRVLAFFALSVAFNGFGTDPQWVQRRDDTRQRAEEALARLLYRYDDDDSGAIEDIPEERSQQPREIVLER